MNVVDPIDMIFRRLDSWRHLPAYQLERRADIFFSVYLKGVVQELEGVELEDEIIPELPIKRDLIWPEHPTDKSVKVDYALFSRDRKRVFFVELKTDDSSRREEQDHYLETAKAIGFRRIVDGVRSILHKTNAHQKYHHLAAALARLGYLDVPPELESYLFPQPRPGAELRACLQRIAVTGEDAAVEVLYLQPHRGAGSERCIDFELFAAHVQKYPDPFSKRFAEHLIRWRSAAGSPLPSLKAL